MSQQVQYEYKNFIIKVDSEGRMTAESGQPVNAGDPHTDLGEVFEITLQSTKDEKGSEKLQLMSLRAAKCPPPAGHCWKWVLGAWKCRPC